MLSNLRAQHWSKALRLFPTHNSKNSKKKDDGSKVEGFELETDLTVQQLTTLRDLTKLYKSQIVTESLVADDDATVKRQYVGKVHARTRLGEETEQILAENTSNILSLMLNSVAF